MATHKSAEKRHKQSLKKRDRNRSAKSTIRTAIKSANVALTGDDKKDAEAKVKKAVSLLGKAKSKGILHKKNSSRNISNLNKKLSSLAS
jgi:small subunit ribosomal protein S20